jgi:hypothetical protein
MDLKQEQEQEQEHNEKDQLIKELTSLELQSKHLKRAYEKAKDECKIKQDKAQKRLDQLTSIIESNTLIKYVENIEGSDTLTKEELTAIYLGIDKTNYNKDPFLKSTGKVYPRFIDLERVVKMTIDIKKQYPGWILNTLKWTSSEDSLPPRNYYSSVYITPHGHKVTL